MNFIGAWLFTNHLIFNFGTLGIALQTTKYCTALRDICWRQQKGLNLHLAISFCFVYCAVDHVYSFTFCVILYFAVEFEDLKRKYIINNLFALITIRYVADYA